MIKGYSPVLAPAELIAASSVLDRELLMFPWYARVNSESNAADWASRLEFDKILTAFATAVQAKVELDPRFM